MIPQEIRDQIADEILADVEHLFAARICPETWEAAFRAAYIVRKRAS